MMATASAPIAAAVSGVIFMRALWAWNRFRAILP
jgi:hypothetical protein